MINEEFIRKVDDKLMADDVKLHARPFRVAIAWMREKNIAGDVFDKSIWNPMMDIYKRLYPNGDFSMPALLVGGVALRDIMYPVRVNVGFGTFSVDPLKCIEIAQEELELMFRHYPEQGWRAFYGVCDLLDFAYGVDDLVKAGSIALDLLNNSRSSIAATPRILTGACDIDAAVQTACLAAELSMKAALKHLGRSEPELKKFSHRLTDLATALIRLKPTSSDDRLRTACANFPNYIDSRYSSHGLTRLELMALSMRAQFVAAEAIRRVTGRNMAGDMEARRDCTRRPEP